jgi:hypothetical protein
MPSTKPRSKKQIAYLISKVIKDRRFDFELATYGFEYEALVADQIVKLSSEKVTVRNFKAIAVGSLPLFEKLFTFSWSDDADSIMKFYSQIEEHFDGQGYIAGKHEFSQQILEYLLVEFKIKYNGDIFKVVQNFTKSDHEIYDFSNSLEETLPKLNLTTDEIIGMLTWLADEIKVEQENVVDLNLPAIGRGLRALCSQKPLQGHELFRKCVVAAPQQLQRFHPSILSGLIDQDITFLKKVKEIIQHPTLQPTVVCALGSTIYNNATPYRKFIDIVESVAAPIENYYLELPRFYTSIIESEYHKDEKLVDYCFDKLISLVKINNKQLHAQVLMQLRNVKNFDQKIGLVLSELISQNYFDESYVPGISNMFYNHADCASFFQIFRQLALKLIPNLPLEKMANDYRMLRNKNKSSFDQGLVDLLIDDIGYLRMLGTRMLIRVSMGHNVSGFGYDVLSLPTVSQYKLVITLAEDFHEPNEVLPYFIPLISSAYDLVRELTLHKIEILSENFGQAVVDVLKERLDLSNIIHSESLIRITEYLERFESELDKKRGIKELDPSLTMYKYLKQYHISRDKNMRERMNKETDKNSFLSFIPTVNLMKGGGWKAPTENKVSKLGTIQTTMRLPREYVLSPQQFDWNRQRAFTENWKNKFDEWEAIISL